MQTLAPPFLPSTRTANAKDHVPTQTSTPALVIPLRSTLRRLVPTHRRPDTRAIPLLGASVGLLTFLVVGLIPALVIGGAAGARVASAMLGGRAVSSSVATAFVVLGLALTAMLGAALFTALGTATGAIVGALTREPRQDAP